MKPSLLANVLANPSWKPQLAVREWETLLEQARRGRLISRLAYRYIDMGWMDEVPEAICRHLEGALRVADRQQHEAKWEIECIRRAMRGNDTPVVILKGAAYLLAGLPPARGRLFSDIDLLVPRARVENVEGQLFAAGWISDERDAYNQRYYREWMHEIPPLRHVQRDTYIDLHHTITPPTSRFNVDGNQLLAHVTELPSHPGFFVLMPADMVLHSAVHLFMEGEFGHGLRDLLDLHDLLLHFGAQAEFWPGLLNRADELGLQIPLFHTLLHLERLFGLTAPAELQPRVHHMGPPPLARAAMRWALSLALQPDHPSCDSTGTDLARWALYVRSHALRMPPHLLIPHLVRKSWMRRFPKAEKAETAEQA